MAEKANEAALVRRLKRREEPAFNEFVLQHQGLVFNVCYRMLGNAAEAEDVAQDVFVKAFKAIGSFRGDSQLSTWLYRIAVNLCKNRLKYLARRQYRASASFEDLTDAHLDGHAGEAMTVGESAPRPDRALEGGRAESRIQQALETLELEFRELLILRDVEGLSYAEMVEVTSLAEGTVKSRLHRARAALRRAYDALEAG